MKNILFFSNGEKIGDGLIKLPFIYEVRKRFPNTQICWMTNEGNTVYNSRLKNIASQYIDIIYESVKLQPFFWKKISKKYKFEDVKFDCIFDTQKAVMRTIALKRIKHNIFISSAAFGIFSSKKILKQKKNKQYYVEELFDLLNLINPDTIKKDYRFNIPFELNKNIKTIFNDKLLYIGYAPGAGENDKIWHIDKYIKVIKYFENNNFQSVFFLGPDDLELKNKIKMMFPKALYPEEIIQNFSGPEIVMACTKYLSIALSNDSGVSHMLSTNYCPLIKLFGTKDPSKFTPDSPFIKTLSAKDYNSKDINSIPTKIVINLIRQEILKHNNSSKHTFRNVQV